MTFLKDEIDITFCKVNITTQKKVRQISKIVSYVINYNN